MRKTIITAAAVAVLSLSACTGSAPAEDQEEAEVAAMPGEQADVEEEDEGQSTEPPPVSESTFGFGESHTYSNGVTVKVAEAGKFTPGEWDAYGEGFTTHRLFTMTVKNGSDAAIDLSMATYIGVSGGVSTDEVFGEYKGNEIGGSPYNKLLPGKSQTWHFALGVMDPEDIQIEVSPDSWEYWPVFFVSEGTES